MKFIVSCFIVLMSISSLAQEAQEGELLKEEKEISERKEQRLKKKETKRKSKNDTSQIISQVLRMEIPIEDMNDEFVVIDGFDDGLLLVQDTKEQVPNGDVWMFRMVDRELDEEWKIDQVIPNSADLIGYDYSSGYYFLLFDNISRYRDYKVLVIDVRGEKSVFQEFSLPFEIDLHYFEALDQGILLVGEYNYRPVALVHDIISGKPKVLPGFYNHNERVFDLVMDEETKSFSIVLAERMRNGKYTNRIKSFTFDGLLIQENLINPGEELNLVDGTTTNFGNGVQYMVGTYSRKSSLFSRGIYISKFSNGQQRFLKDYNYGDLRNFFKYRGERASRRIYRKVARKKGRGKEPKFSYRLYIHDIVEKGDLNIVIAEAFYAKYSSSTGTNYYGGGYNPNYRTNSRTLPSQRAFLGYKFTHAIVCAFDSKGNIVWDNSFKTNDITSYNLEESVAVNVQGERAVIMYLDDNLIKSQVVQRDDVEEGKTYNPIKLLNNGDKLKSRDSSVKGLKSWYDNNLYSFGVQKIKNKSFPKKERIRRVFYINKIQFDSTPVEQNDFRISSTK